MKYNEIIDSGFTTEIAEDVPCDFRHVNKIEVAEKDDDGNYETL